jgi:RHS repeat-associated protein
VQYVYDENGRAKTIDDPSTGLFTFGYNELGQLATLTRPNGVDDSFSYTPSGDLASLVARRKGATVAGFEYGIDPTTGRRESLTDVLGKSTFTYYGNGMLKAATHPAASGLPNESYTYDKAGNRISGTGIVGTASVNQADELLSDGRFTYKYDGEGDLLSKEPIGGGSATTYEWNADHQLVGIHYPDGASSAYRYDPVGRRIAALDKGKEERFVYEGDTPHADYDAANHLTTHYVTNPADNSLLESVSATGSSYIITDGLGSARLVTNGEGGVIGTYAYDAFGQPASGNPSSARATFTGYPFDAASDLYAAGARYYDPASGRFLSEDPVPTVNPYPYAANDPVNLIDPTGEQPFTDEAETAQRDALIAGQIQRNTILFNRLWARLAYGFLDPTLEFPVAELGPLGTKVVWTILGVIGLGYSAPIWGPLIGGHSTSPQHTGPGVTPTPTPSPQGAPTRPQVGPYTPSMPPGPACPSDELAYPCSTGP